MDRLMTWYSQAGQDEWVHGIIGDCGYFVDCGAHDGLVHSNTWALEQRGWTGICIEPNVAAYEALLRNRSGGGLQVAASDREGVIAFDGTCVNRGPDLVSCYPLRDLLALFGKSRQVIDYLSIDVEGHELQVLAGMDFDRWKVKLITIEHNLYCDGPDRKNAIYDMLTGHGFDRVVEDVVAPGYGEYEDWFVNHEV